MNHMYPLYHMYPLDVYTLYRRGHITLLRYQLLVLTEQRGIAGRGRGGVTCASHPPQSIHARIIVSDQLGPQQENLDFLSSSSCRFRALLLADPDVLGSELSDWLPSLYMDPSLVLPSLISSIYLM